MGERDDELGRALGDLPVPEHGPGFWAELDRRVQDPDVVPLGGRRGDAADGGGGGARGGRDRSPGGRDRQLRRLLAAAAVAVVAAGGVAVAVGRDTDDRLTVTNESTTVPPASEPSPSIPGSVGEPEELGSGLVVGALPAADGSTTVLVRDDLPGDEPGCEGQPQGGLLVLGPGGDQRPVEAADGSLVTEGVDVHPSLDRRRVAVVSQCEGFLVQVLVGVVGPDGVPEELRPVAGQGSDDATVGGAPDIEVSPQVSWSPDGHRLLLTAAAFTDDGVLARELWEHDVDRGTWTRRGDAPEGPVAAVERADGSLVSITEDALVIGDERTDRRGVNALRLGPDGSTVAAYGEAGVLLIDEGGDLRLLADGLVNDARFGPDGSWLVVGRLAEGGDVVELASVPADGSAGPTVLGASLFGWFELLPEGRGLLVTVEGEQDPDGFPRPSVQRWPFEG